MKNSWYYVIGFVEGASLMAFQLLTSRILAGAYGSTIDVWAVLLSFTLLGLAFGYFYGGRISQKDEKGILFYLLTASFVLILILPWFQKFMLFVGLNLPDITGLFLFGLLAVAPVTFLFGVITPVLIKSITNADTSFLAGKLYAVSTIGGVLGTFAFGLYFIPFHGVMKSSFLCSFFLGLVTFLAYRISKK